MRLYQPSPFLPDLPRISLSFGSKLNPDSIKEGDDAYFECSVNAKPRAIKIQWKFNVSWASRSGKPVFTVVRMPTLSVRMPDDCYL